MHVLLVEDQPALQRSLAAGLEKAGAIVHVVGDGLGAAGLLATEDYDAVVLDLGLPGIDGWEVLRRLRARGKDTPVLILTAAGDLHDRVRGLDTGADDYLTKPFELEELVARLRAIVRRRVGQTQALWRLGRLSFDTARRQFALGELPLALAPREHGMLELLLAHAGRPISKDRLCDRLARDDEVPSASALEICVHRLRRKLDGSGL